jgi:transcriptional regulator GlxA family with amidase domain
MFFFGIRDMKKDLVIQKLVKIANTQEMLLKKLADKRIIDKIVTSTIETIFSTNGQFSVNEFSKSNNINRRQLARKFSSAIGLSPKQLAKTILSDLQTEGQVTILQ